jgi:type IV conjugative transfer system protein TraL
MEDRYRVLKSLDNPVRVFTWDIDQVLAVTAPMLLGILFGSVLLFLSGFAFGFANNRLRKGTHRGDFISRLYWYLPTKSLKKRGLFKNLPDSHKRELLL